MPYLNIDDGMDEHPKIEALSSDAFRMHIAAMLYSARRGTDGLITLARSRKIGTDALAAELARTLPTEDNPVWHDLGEGCGTDTCPAGVPGHYRIHDYLQWNHSKAWWDARRRAETERKAEYRARRNKGPNKGVPSGQTAGHDTGKDAGRDVSEPEPEPEPEPQPIPVSLGSHVDSSDAASTTDRTREPDPWLAIT